MGDRDTGGHGAHGGMNHGMGMMLLGCGVPMAAIVLLPRLGVSPQAAIVIGVVGMVALHGAMMLFQRLRNRGAEKAPDAASLEHHHH